MALAARIRAITNTGRGGAEGGGETTDLSLSGRLVVSVDYVDDAKPNTVLLSHDFNVTSDSSEADIQAMIRAYGRKVRDARVRVADMQKYVGALIPLDDSGA